MAKRKLKYDNYNMKSLNNKTGKLKQLPNKNYKENA